MLPMKEMKVRNSIMGRMRYRSNQYLPLSTTAARNTIQRSEKKKKKLKRSRLIQKDEGSIPD
jgi:hypothetical protein